MERGRSDVGTPAAPARYLRARRLLGLAGAVLAAAIVSLIVTHSTGHATSDGDPYTTPTVVDTNPDPHVVETTLTAKEANVDIGNGVIAKAQTFNGSIPGPTFHLEVGDTVIVHFVNQLPSESGIHWHGVEVPNAMDGTPLTKNPIPPGGTFLYKFKVNRPGIFWYHPHHHSSTNQVFKGMYGMIVVEDPNDAQLRNIGTLPSLADTRQIVLSDTTVCKAQGQNPSATAGQPHAYDDKDDNTPGSVAPWVNGANLLPVQAPPSPKDLCETSPLDEKGALRGPFGAGDIPNIQQNKAGRTNEGITVLTNGKNVGARSGGPTGQSGSPPGALAPGASTLEVKRNQGVRLQLLNAAAVRYMRLRYTNAQGTLLPLLRVGGEGGLLNSVIQEGGINGQQFDPKYLAGEQLLPPGSRADVVFRIPAGAADGDVLTIWTEDYSRTGQGFSNIPTVPVMHLKVNGTAAQPFTTSAGTLLRSAIGDPVEVLGSPTGTLLNPAGFGKLGMASQNISLTATANVANGIGSTANDGVKGIHDVSGDYGSAPHMGSSRYAKAGDILQLTVQNTTGANHPFHLHGFSIQPIQLKDAANHTLQFPPEFRDNVDVPGGDTLTFRVRVEDRPLTDGTTSGGAYGRWVFHCHIFFHAVDGMISELVVTDQNGNEKPNVNTDKTQVTVDQGQTASMTGTFNDPDGDPVKLEASVGTVTPNGNAWTWTYPTGTDNSRFVYITATDSKNPNLKSQIPFFLQINNSAPSIQVPGPQSVATGKRLAFAFSGSDPDAPDTLSLGASGLPASLTSIDNGNRTATVSGRATAAPGTYNATLSANDGRHPAATGNVQITIRPFAAVVDHPERMVRGAIAVICRFYSPSIRTCSGSVFRGRGRVGRASTSTRRRGRRTLTLRVVLSRTTRRRVAHSLGGVPIRVSLSGRKFGDGTTFTDADATTVVVPRLVVTPRFAMFAAGTQLTPRARTYLVSVARTVGVARRIVCTGHSDSGSRAQARARAAAACAALRTAGLSARFSAVGASRPFSRRVAITILR